MNPHASQPALCYELYFPSFGLRDGWAFPCDASGHVDMDAMSGRARNNYLFARALIGIEVDAPRVRMNAGPCQCRTRCPCEAVGQVR